MRPWKTLRKRTIYNQAPWLEVEHHAVELPDGQVIPDWPWIKTPDYINVVAVTAENTYLCFRQTKYGIQGETLALIGGYLEPGEAPLAAAPSASCAKRPVVRLPNGSTWAISWWTPTAAWRRATFTWRGGPRTLQRQIPTTWKRSA